MVEEEKPIQENKAEKKSSAKRILGLFIAFDLLVAIIFLMFLGIKQCSHKNSNSGSSSDSAIKYDTTKLNDAFKYLVDKQILTNGYEDTLDKVVSVTYVDNYPNTFSLDITMTSNNDKVYFYSLSNYSYPESKEGYEDFVSYLLLNDNYKSLNPEVNMDQAVKIESTNFPTNKTNSNYVVGQNNHYYFSGSYFENNNYYVYQKKEIESGTDPFVLEADQVIDSNKPLYSYYQSLSE